MKKQHFLVRLFAFALTVCTLIIGLPMPVHAEEVELSDEQRNAIAMLNYITVLTQDINASKNSRLYMEEAYSLLINNTYPNAVDSRTQSQLTSLLDIMESYRMIDVKRERLQYIYEQNQAQAIRAAMPNPLALMSAMQAFRPEKLAAAIVYMAVDSISSYTAYTKETDLQYLKDGWALDDDEAEVLHSSRKGTFSYMISMVRDNDLPGDLTLTENAVEELIEWKNNDNTVGRIRFLESNQNTYQSYGGYWLILAESYYANGNYAKSLDALASYEGLEARIFRRDYELAKILPLMISAAEKIYSIHKYEEFAAHYGQSILDNTDHDAWALRYFAAQTYMDLYGKTRKRSYLQKAYSITLDNVNYLVGEQRAMNAAYLAPVQEKTVPKGVTKEEKKQISNYNKMLKENRKKEMPPVYEPLLLNCELLFALADKLNISESEQRNIEGILHLKGETIFLTTALDSRYWFTPETQETPVEIEYEGQNLKLPAFCLTENARITVTVKEPDAEEPAVFTDWQLNSVERVTDSDISTFQAAYTSKEAGDHPWVPDADITIEIQPREGIDLTAYLFEYQTKGTKEVWYDYFKFWEGYKNKWHEYVKVWENSVIFERVK